MKIRSSCPVWMFSGSRAYSETHGFIPWDLDLGRIQLAMFRRRSARELKKRLICAEHLVVGRKIVEH